MADRTKSRGERPVILWLRGALRLRDNPALDEALRLARAEGAEPSAPVIPVHFEDEEEGRWTPGPASRWWLDRSLAAFDADLRSRGSRLIVRAEPASVGLPALAAHLGAASVVADRRWEPSRTTSDERLSRGLAELGVPMHLVASDLLFDPEAVQTRDGRPFTTFTPYWQACLRLPPPSAVTDPPDRIPAPRTWPADATPNRLAPSTARIEAAAWIPGSPEWEPGETGARRSLTAFLADGLDDYDWARDRPDLEGTSRLSPHLHFGEISPRQVWHEVAARAVAASGAGAEVFLKELGWREFAHHLLHHHPETPERPLRTQFESFPWEDDPEGLDVWRRGGTGFPIVDAGMRQLSATGWMHNRVRMIVASFLVKDLLLPWQEGASWFWRRLVDADLANNTLGWQWAAGCGADAAPYFRVFNPVLQGSRHDPKGDYVRTWVPELARVPDGWIHRPWEAGPGTLEDAGVRLGLDYPRPIVDHARARQAALAAWRSIREL